MWETPVPIPNTMVKTQAADGTAPVSYTHLLVHFFNEDGLGAIVNSSRGIIAAYKQEQYAKYGAENFGDASRAAVEAMIADIGGALNNR